jgi:hypothetical protein
MTAETSQPQGILKLTDPIADAAKKYLTEDVALHVRS